MHAHRTDSCISTVSIVPCILVDIIINQVCHIVSGRVVGVNAEQETRPQHPDAANDDDSVDDRGGVTDKPKDSNVGVSRGQASSIGIPHS